MKIRISKKELLDAITIANKAVNNTTPLPILSCLKLDASNNSLTIISSDSNISIKKTITTDNNVLTIESEGEIVVDAKYIIEIVRKVDSEYVDIEVIDGEYILISGGSSEFKINGLRVNEYPNISFNISNDVFLIDAQSFIDLINKTIFACSDKETRPILTGVNLKTENNKLIATASDSSRFAYKEINIENLPQFNITIPAKYLLEITRSITNENLINISIDSQQIFFMFNNTVIKTRLFDDLFPDTSKIIPTQTTQVLKVNSKEFLDQLDRMSFIKSENNKTVVRLSINDTYVDINSSDNVSSFYGKMSVISFEGKPFEISCSVKYLIDAIKALSSDVVSLYFSGELKPIILKNDEDSSLLQLIAPIRTYK